MIETRLRTLGLSHFDYTATAWYKAILEKRRIYSRGILSGAIAIALFIPLIQLISDISRSIHEFIPHYLVSFFVFAVLAFCIFRSRDQDRVVVVALGIASIGCCFSFLFPTGRDINLAVSILYPLFALQLAGSRQGSLWCLVTVSAVVLMWGLYRIGINPWWSFHPVPRQIAFFSITLLGVYGLSIATEKRHEAMINRLADLLMFDPDTGLPNRDVLLRTIKADQHYVFAIIKIENFSDLVALFGYDFSDTITRFASTRLRLLEGFFKYRTYQLKFNEYGLLMETDHLCSLSEAESVLYELVRTIEVETLPWEGDKINLLYRVGGTVVPAGSGENPLSQADVALKKAERCHSVLSIYDNSNCEQKTARDAVHKFTQLIMNREDGTFRVVFQPVFNMDGTEIEWYEALLRIRNSYGEFTSIYPYLSVARSTGFYPYLTDFVLKKAGDVIVSFDIDVSVNISVSDILRPDFIAVVDSVYKRIKEKKGRIIFEIIESDELVELDKCILFIDYISRYGFKIAIDDFGSGYSNYANLVNLPVDIVKIDGSLIKKMKTDDNARTLVEGIIHFCRKASKKTVAEFVEDEHIFSAVKCMEVDFLQGYYLGKPEALQHSTSSIVTDYKP